MQGPFKDKACRYCGEMFTPPKNKGSRVHCDRTECITAHEKAIKKYQRDYSQKYRDNNRENRPKYGKRFGGNGWSRNPLYPGEKISLCVLCHCQTTNRFGYCDRCREAKIDQYQLTGNYEAAMMG